MEERLKRFAVVVDAGTFTKAAEELHTSQPALSMAIQKLEQELKSQLIEHKGRGFVLTPAGRLAYESGKRIIREARHLKSAMEAFSQGRPTAKIGAIDNIAELLFVENDELAKLQEEANVSLFINNSASLIHAVLEGQIDIALVVEQQTFPQELSIDQLGAEELVAVCSASSQMNVARRLGQGFLPHFMSYNQLSTTFALIDSYLASVGVTPETLFYSTSPSIMLELAIQGKGTAILPRHMVSKGVIDGALIELHLGDAQILRPIVSVRDNAFTMPSSIESFLAESAQILARASR